MMASFENVEKLRERANVSYDEAKAALDACGDDLLEAMIQLEREGKVNTPQNGGSYSTRWHTGSTGGQDAGSQSQHPRGERFGAVMKRLWGRFLALLNKGNTNSFDVHKDDRRVFTMPVTVLVLLLIFCFWFTLPLLVIGLFCGCKYSFRGPQMDENRVNEIMDSASKVADDIKKDVITLTLEDEEK